jgi:arylsulfatase A-like enzyme
VSVGAEHIDLMPSIIDAVGGEIPEGVQGESLLQLSQSKISYARPAISSWFLNQYALTIGQYKWVHKTRFEGELYDIKNQPEEKKTVTKEKPIAARFAQEMMSLYLPFQASWKKRTWGVPSNVTEVFMTEASKAPIRL